MTRYAWLVSGVLLLGACNTDAFCIDCTRGDAAVAGGTDSAIPQGDAAPGAGGTGASGAGGSGGVAGNGGAGGGIGCIPSTAGEACNQLDDDCDGQIDEDFDLMTNPYHCGACEHPCEVKNGEAKCRAGVCVSTGCLNGFADLDGKTGCEYRCPVFPPAAEDCNGKDDDCDGKIDEQLTAPPQGLCRTTAGTPCAAVKAVCEKRGKQTTWFCDYPKGVEFDPSVPNGIAIQETRCDGHDGDCDGVVDDPWPDVGTPCDDGEKGACRNGGAIVCDPSNDSKVICDLSLPPDPVPGAGSGATELCNGVDDDCDGDIDDGAKDDMIHVTFGANNFWMYTYEASHPDGDAAVQGISVARACSKADALPWTYVAYDAAAAACAAAGHRLCTGAEWQAGCEGAALRSYPYGTSYAADSCNGADRDAVPGGAIDSVLEPGGSLNMCVSLAGIYDLSGNVKEWTNDPQGTSGPPNNTPIYVVRGGSFESPALGLTCQTNLSQATRDTILPTLGFRCCSDTAP